MSSTNLSSIALETQTEFALQNGTHSGGDMEKIVAMVSLGLGSFVCGMLPAFISERNRRRFPYTNSLLLCFGAGVLLATALVHILPEVRSQMKTSFAEVSLCGGFFIIYFIDEFIHYFFGEAIQHRHEGVNSNNTPASTGNHQHSYGSNDERRPLLEETSNGHSHNNGHSHGNSNGHSHSHENQVVQITRPHCDDNVVADANARICHTSHIEPCSESMTGTLGLFAALSLHSTIEGMVIGVQNSATKVYFLLGAVACHKYVMAFCLGVESRSNAQNSLKSQFIGILVFALGAVAGIGIGMIIVDVPSEWMNTTLPVIQGLAGGTLFYVTVCEVIPREKARWHQNVEFKAAGFGQFFAVALGFAAMTVINFYISDED